MLIKLFCINENGESEVKEIHNDNNAFAARVEHRLAPNPADPYGQMIIASDGSLTLKFETPLHTMALEESRVELYKLYRELKTRQDTLVGIEVYNHDILIFNSQTLNLKPQDPLLIDTAFSTVEEDRERDIHIIVQIDLMWGEE